MEKRIVNFYDLEAWKLSHLLVMEIYKVTKDFPKEEQYGIVSQLRRSASSITANIAEGFARYHFKDKIRFYYQARGSAAEAQNFIILARDLGYLNERKNRDLFNLSKQSEQLVNGLIRSIEKQLIS